MGSLEPQGKSPVATTCWARAVLPNAQHSLRQDVGRSVKASFDTWRFWKFGEGEGPASCIKSICIYMYIYICIYTSFCKCLNIYLHAHIYVRMYMYLCICVYICMTRKICAEGRSLELGLLQASMETRVLVADTYAFGLYRFGPRTVEKIPHCGIASRFSTGSWRFSYSILTLSRASIENETNFARLLEDVDFCLRRVYALSSQ